MRLPFVAEQVLSGVHWQVETTCVPHIASALPAILEMLNSCGGCDKTVAYLEAKFIIQDAN